MSDKAALEYQREAKDKLEKLYKFDLDKIRNSEGVKNHKSNIHDGIEHSVPESGCVFQKRR